MSAYLNYSPTSIDDVVLPNGLADALRAMVAEDNLQPMLFYGAPGTGKSLTATLLTKNHLRLRCDGRDSPTETLNTAWKAATTINVEDTDTRRLIILDELDRWDTRIQERTRALIDECGQFTSFVATTNYIDEVIPALQSRLKPICFNVERGNVTMREKWEQRLSTLHQQVHGRPIEEHFLSAILKHFPDGRNMMSSLVSGIL
jgi:replication-associated recombination protein RarA